MTCTCKLTNGKCKFTNGGGNSDYRTPKGAVGPRQPFGVKLEYGVRAENNVAFSKPGNSVFAVL